MKTGTRKTRSSLLSDLGVVSLASVASLVLCVVLATVGIFAGSTSGWMVLALSAPLATFVVLVVLAAMAWRAGRRRLALLFVPVLLLVPPAGQVVEFVPWMALTAEADLRAQAHLDAGAHGPVPAAWWQLPVEAAPGPDGATCYAVPRPVLWPAEGCGRPGDRLVLIQD